MLIGKLAERTVSSVAVAPRSLLRPTVAVAVLAATLAKMQGLPNLMAASLVSLVGRPFFELIVIVFARSQALFVLPAIGLS